MIKVVSYKDLVLNTMLDTIKREKRYTVDNRDIMQYEDVIDEIIKYNGLDIAIGSLNNGHEFISEIENYVYISELAGNQVYTLLPWIGDEELEDEVADTIFSRKDMDIVSEFTKDYLRFSRDNFELYHLRKIEVEVGRASKADIENNIRSLECKINREEEKLQKVKRRLKIGE